jgi:hypothetical protein
MVAGAAMKPDAVDERLQEYFYRRALDFLEQAKAENDPIRRLDLEARIATYWRIARGDR